MYRSSGVTDQGGGNRSCRRALQTAAESLVPLAFEIDVFAAELLEQVDTAEEAKKVLENRSPNLDGGEYGGRSVLEYALLYECQEFASSRWVQAYCDQIWCSPCLPGGCMPTDQEELDQEDLELLYTRAESRAKTMLKMSWAVVIAVPVLALTSALYGVLNVFRASRDEHLRQRLKLLEMLWAVPGKPLLSCRPLQ
jgi:hypothetical protein